MISKAEIEEAADVLQRELTPPRTREYCLGLARKVLEAATAVRYRETYKKAFGDANPHL